MPGPSGEKESPVWYGKLSGIVVGAVGLFFERKPVQMALPCSTPNLSSSARTINAEVTSAPPPRPKIPPNSEAVAMTSVAFQFFNVAPKAVYSPGIKASFLRACLM